MKKKTEIVSKDPVTEAFSNINEEVTFLEWQAAERAFKKRDRDFWVTAISILILVSVIFIFLKEFLVVFALASVVFLYYALATVPPRIITYKITNRGIYMEEVKFEWEKLIRFWFKPNLDTEMIHFETIQKFPGQVSLVINPKDKDKLKDVIIKRLPLLESPPSFVEKTTKWFADRLPLEDKKK